MIRQTTFLNNILDIIIKNQENFIKNICVGKHIRNYEHNTILFALRAGFCVKYLSKYFLNSKLENVESFKNKIKIFRQMSNAVSRCLTMSNAIDV